MRLDTRPSTTERAGNVTVSTATRPADSKEVLNRLKLALLDGYVGEKPGYDPYDTARNRSTPDLWMAKPKRA